MEDNIPPPGPLPEPLISPTPETVEVDFQHFKELCHKHPHYMNHDDTELRMLWNMWYPTCKIAWEAPSE